MKKLLLLTTLIISATQLFAQDCSDLFISEYVEGNYNNKAIEIYNPTSLPINLSKYRLIRWNNGSATYNPQGAVDLPDFEIASHDVAVLVIDKTDCTLGGQDTCVFEGLKNAADWYLCADYNICNALSHNGNDALSLNKKDGNTPGAFVDVFGLIGEDPGQSWTDTAPYTQSAGGAYWTKDQTLIRKQTVKKGIVISSTPGPGTPYTGAFNPTAEWDSLPINTFNQLGFHKCDCGSTAVVNTNTVKINMEPNPANNVLFISANKLINRIEIYDLAGKMVHYQTILSQKQSILINQLPSGTYIVKTNLSDKSVSYNKIVKQ